MIGCLLAVGVGHPRPELSHHHPAQDAPDPGGPAVRILLRPPQSHHHGRRQQTRPPPTQNQVGGTQLNLFRSNMIEIKQTNVETGWPNRMRARLPIMVSRVRFPIPSTFRKFLKQ